MSYDRNQEDEQLRLADAAHTARCEYLDDLGYPSAEAWQADYDRALAEQRAARQREQEELNARIEATAEDREYEAGEQYRWRSRLNAWLREQSRRRTESQ